jgi:hypothetical protein
MADTTSLVTGGVDTHKDFHVCVAVDELGRVLGTEQFSTTLRGYRSLFRWLGAFGQLGAVGVEGTGSWGAGLARFLTDAGVEVIEVNRPNRQARRKRGKSDPADAEAAARAVLAGEAVGTPKAATGTVESIRLLRVARRSAMKARTQAANQVHSVIDTAPEELRAKLIGLKERERITKAARMRSNDTSTPLGAAKFALAALAAGSCSPRRSPSSTLTSPCSSRALRHRSSTSKALGSRQPPRCSPPRATIRRGSAQTAPSPHCVARHLSTPRRDDNFDIASIGVVIDKPTAPST